MKLQGIFILIFSLLAWADSPKPQAHKQHFKVMLDPGHGGEDAGAKGPKKLLEKDAALALALDLAQNLTQSGCEVSLTRSEDMFIPLGERAKIANAAGADIFLSLHFNAARSRRARGSEVFFLSLDQGDADAAEIVAAENASEEHQETQDVLSSILDDLAQKAFLQDSERLAIAIQTQLNQLNGIKQRGVKQAPFAVLRRAAMPAVLVEAAFISNPKEEQKLRDPAFRKRIAEAIATGIKEFLTPGRTVPRRKAISTPSKKEAARPAASATKP